MKSDTLVVDVSCHAMWLAYPRNMNQRFQDAFVQQKHPSKLFLPSHRAKSRHPDKQMLGCCVVFISTCLIPVAASEIDRNLRITPIPSASFVDRVHQQSARITQPAVCLKLEMEVSARKASTAGPQQHCIVHLQRIAVLWYSLCQPRVLCKKTSGLAKVTS